MIALESTLFDIIIHFNIDFNHYIKYRNIVTRKKIKGEKLMGFAELGTVPSNPRFNVNDMFEVRARVDHPIVSKILVIFLP